MKDEEELRLSLESEMNQKKVIKSGDNFFVMDSNDGNQWESHFNEASGHSMESSDDYGAKSNLDESKDSSNESVEKLRATTKIITASVSKDEQLMVSDKITDLNDTVNEAVEDMELEETTDPAKERRLCIVT